MLFTVAAGLLRCRIFTRPWYSIDLDAHDEEDGNGSSNLQVINNIAPRTLYSYLTRTISFTTPRTFLQLAPSPISTLEPDPSIEASYPAVYHVIAMDSVHHCLDSISSTVYSTHKGDDGA